MRITIVAALLVAAGALTPFGGSIAAPQIRSADLGGAQTYPAAAVPVSMPPPISTESASPLKPARSVADPRGTVSAREVVRYSNAYAGCSGDPTRPMTIRDLDGGSRVFYHTLAEDSAIQLNIIPFGTAARKKRSVVQVFQFLQYASRTCDVDGVATEVIWGVGTKAVLHVKDAKNDVNLNQLTLLAAAVQYNRAEVSFSMDTVGITGEPVIKVLPDAGAFNVENYGKMVSATDQVRLLLYDPNVTIRPQLLKPLPGSTPSIR